MPTPTSFTFEQTPEQRKAEEIIRARHAKITRAVCNTLAFWRFCSAGACRRGHLCVGDAGACFRRHWPNVPEDIKVWLRAMIKARAAGHSMEQTARIAAAEMEQYAESMDGETMKVATADGETTAKREAPAMPRGRPL